MSLLPAGDVLPLTTRLSIAIDVAREISLHNDPQQMLAAYRQRMRSILPFDRTLSLSRRGLERPHYRITRSDLWTDSPNPWTESHRLPVLSDGVLGSLLYNGQVVLQNGFAACDSDPAFEHLAGMQSLIAIPHFDEGEAINMVVHLCREPRAFDADALPDFVLMSSLFGRATKVMSTLIELRKTDARIKLQNETLQQMTDTIIEQALSLKQHAERLETRVRERTGELQSAHLESIFMLATACEAKDADTGSHVRRIREIVRRIAERLSLRDAESIGYAAILHDVGKMHVPDEILQKPGPLTPGERATMELHTLAGERILGESAYFAEARAIARWHHENIDGSGYPDGLKGEQIPIAARITRVADFYDAVTTERVYKSAWPHERAADELRRGAGTVFDRAVVEAMLAVPRSYI